MQRYATECPDHFALTTHGPCFVDERRKCSETTQYADQDERTKGRRKQLSGIYKTRYKPYCEASDQIDDECAVWKRRQERFLNDPADTVTEDGSNEASNANPSGNEQRRFQEIR